LITIFKNYSLLLVEQALTAIILCIAEPKKYYNLTGNSTSHLIGQSGDLQIGSTTI